MLFKTFNKQQNLTLPEGSETAAQINEELKRTEFDGALCKKFKLQNFKSSNPAIDFLHFLGKRRKIGTENDTSKAKQGSLNV